MERKTRAEILTPEEIEDVQVEIINNTQRAAFPEEYSALIQNRELPWHSKLHVLLPRIDEDCLIRSVGRLKYAEFISHDTWFPIILPQ